MKNLRLSSLVIIAALMCLSAPCRADVALLVEDPAGYKGFWSDSGHLAVWISNACVGGAGVVRLCSAGSGVVLSSTSYWANRGWAAIPAATYLDGVVDKQETDAWSDTLQETYPAIPVRYGRKYIGRLNHRGSYVIRIHTSPEKDAQVLEQIQQGRSRFRYAVFSNNCSDFARQVLELYFPQAFHRRILPDFGISTPRGVANRFWKLGHRVPELGMQIYYIPRQTPAGYLHDGRTKGICDAAVTDVKYALPLIFYQPIAYAAFGVCYLAFDQPAWMHRGFVHEAQRVRSFTDLETSFRMARKEKSPIEKIQPTGLVPASETETVVIPAETRSAPLVELP